MQNMIGSQTGRASWAQAAIVFTFLLVVLVITRQVLVSKEGESDMNSLKLNRKTLDVATWNIAAINNNPFEYWITSNNTNYLKLMLGVSQFIDKPSPAQDVKVSEVLNQTMVDELFALMRAARMKGVNETIEYWNKDYSQRSIIQGFMKDDMIGKKRLTSMPDRVTNTVSAEDKVVYRPTVINCYEGKLDSMADWWKAWKQFFFSSKLNVRKNGSVTAVKGVQLLAPISQAKYPSISKEEAAASLPLQTLCLAIFDAILVHMMQQLSGRQWQGVRGEICRELNHKKLDRTVQILEQSYVDMDVIFLQEVAANFRQVATKRALGGGFDVLQPADLDTDRDQNSFVLLKKGRFAEVCRRCDCFLCLLHLSL
jgi:hypothetical protein